MKNNILEYKKYLTKIEVSMEDMVLHGKIEGIDDLITFESDTIEGIERSFHEAVEDYLSFCADLNKEPNKTYKGVFNVRISPELHRKAAVQAFRKDITLNQLVQRAITAYVSEKSQTELKLHETISSLTNMVMYQSAQLQQLPRIKTNYKFNSDGINYKTACI